MIIELTTAGVVKEQLLAYIDAGKSTSPTAQQLTRDLDLANGHHMWLVETFRPRRATAGDQPVAVGGLVNCSMAI